MKVKFFIVEYIKASGEVSARFCNYEEQMAEAEAFCKTVRTAGGSVNIRIRDVEVPN